MYLTGYRMVHRLPSGRSVLVNTLTGSVDFVSEKAAKQLSQDAAAFPVLDIAEEAKLRSRKYIFDSQKEEESLIENIHTREMQRLEKRPYVFAFCLTYACNLRCFYCFEDNYHQAAQVMGKEDIDAALRRIEDKAGEREECSFRVVLEGGEPFLKGQEEILAYFFRKMRQLKEKYRGFKGVTVFTNGENTLSYLELIKSSRQVIDQILITLAGNEKVHNSYRISLSGKGNYKNAVQATSVLLENGLPVMTVLNLDKNNIRSLPELSEELGVLKWSRYQNYRGCYVSSIKYFDKESLENTLSEYDIWRMLLDFSRRKMINESQFNMGDMKILKNIDRLVKEGEANFYHCAADNGKQYLFGPDGLIYNCTKVTAKEEYSIGAYREPAALCEERVRWWSSGSVAENAQCKSCRFAFVCGGKCPYAEKRLGFRQEECQKDIASLMGLYLDQMEAGGGLVQKDIIYEN